MFNERGADSTPSGDPLFCDPSFDHDAHAAVQLETDFARHFLSLPDAPDDRPPPDPTLDDVIDEAADQAGADRIAAEARALDPGPLTARMLSVITPSRLSPAGLLDAACAAERLASWTQATQHRQLAAFARPGVAVPAEALAAYASAPGKPLHQSAASSAGCGGGPRADGELTSSGSQVFGADTAEQRALALTSMLVAAAEVSAALKVSPISANRRVAQAVNFVDDLPATLTALQGGVIDRGRALVIADRTQNLPTDLRRRVEAIIVPKAASRTAGQLRGIADRAVIAADPEAAKKRHEAARRNRGVSLRATEDGMSQFRAELAADRAGTAFTVIDQIAVTNSRNSAEHRPIGALRADAFADIFDQLADHGSVHLHSVLSRGYTNNDFPDHFRESGPTATGPSPEDSPVASDEVPTTAEDVAVASDEVPTTAEDVAVASDEVPTTAEDVPASADDLRDASTGETDDSTTGSAARTCESAPGDLAGPFPVDPHRAGPDAPEEQGADRPPMSPDPAGVADHSATPRPTTPSGLAADCRCHRPGNQPAPSFWGLGRHQGRTTGLNVTIAATTLAGLDDLPGELDGHGAIPADMARALAVSAATITAVAVNPACGTALDLGRTTYRPRLAQRDNVTLRDQTCRFPGCRQPAWRCQLDHSDEFCPGNDDGGITCPCNLACLCKFHHDLKTFNLWDAEHHPDNSITWTSGTGRTYTTKPKEWTTGIVDAIPPSQPVVSTTTCGEGVSPTELGSAATIGTSGGQGPGEDHVTDRRDQTDIGDQSDHENPADLVQEPEGHPHPDLRVISDDDNPPF